MPTCRPSSWLALLAATLLAPPLAAQGFAAVDAAVEWGIRRGTYPGAVVVVGRADTILYAKGYGRFTWSMTARRPDPATTLWDIASLSKVVATASAAAALVDRGLLDLDAPVPKYLPEFRGAGKDHVTVRMLLDHTSGLPASAILWKNGATSTTARSRLFDVGLSRDPGTAPLYSDLNAILAAMVVERVSGQRFDAFTFDNIFKPLGMTATTWTPETARRRDVVPTARYRGQPVAGVVNDQNARVLGGIAGNAGVFSTGMDLAHFAQSWLRGLTLPRGGTGPWIDSRTLGTFTERSAMSGSRALGWDTPIVPDDGGPSLYGWCSTPTTLGHTGWTGTTLWIDRSADLFVVFLTNRSYQPRSASASFGQMREIRASVSDAARRAVGACDAPVSDPGRP